MGKGGARANSGPAPDPNALRRERDAGDWVLLPSTGRPGPAPKWPFATQTDREAIVWADLWAKPQALMWERFGQEHEVALHVRTFVMAEELDAPVARVTLARQQADSLGITTPGMRANRWKVAQGELPAGSGTPVATRSTSRDRLQIVRNDDGD